MSKTKEDVHKLLDSYDEALKHWTSNISNAENFTQIQSAKVAKPLEELKKLLKLIKAHTTKVGIIYKPQNLVKELNPAYTTLSKLSETIVLVVSVLVQLDPSTTSQLFYDAVLTQIRQLLSLNVTFVAELRHLLENAQNLAQSEEDAKDDGEVNGRLVTVGKIWSVCDETYDLVNNGRLHLLTERIAGSIELIEDGFEEFEEWSENPQDADEDPFGFSDSDDEKSDDGKNPPEEAQDSDPDAHQDLIKYAKKWLKKIELVKLLIGSFKKSLPKTISGEDIDKIYALQQQLVGLIDKFIVDLMLDGTVDEEIDKITNDIQKVSMKLTRTAQSVHKQNDKKAKWYAAWETKFEQNTE